MAQPLATDERRGSSTARDLFKEMDALFGPLSPEIQDVAQLEINTDGAASVGPSRRSSLVEAHNTDDLAPAKPASSEPSLLSPFTLSSATFDSVGSPESPATRITPIHAAIPAPPADYTPANVEAPKLDGSMPRFPTPDAITLGLTPSSAGDAPLRSPTPSLSNERRPSRSSPLNPANSRPTSRAPSPSKASPVSSQSGSPAPARARAKSFLGMRIRSKSAAETTESTPPLPRPATTLLGLGFQAESPLSPPVMGEARPRRPSLSSSISRIWSKRDTMDSPPPIPVSPSVVVASPSSDQLTRSPSSMGPLGSAEGPGLRKVQSFLFSATGTPPKDGADVIPYHMHGVPTSAPSPLPHPPSPSQPRKTAPTPLTLDGLGFAGAIILPSATSPLWQSDDGPYAALRTVGRSTAPSSPVSPTMLSPVMIKPKISLSLEPTVTNAAGNIETPRRSVSLTSFSGPISPVEPSQSRLNSMLSPDSAARPMPFQRPPPTNIEPPASLKALRRLSSLSALPDRLAQDRVREQEQEIIAEPKAKASANLRRRSSLSYLQPSATEKSLSSLASGGSPVELLAPALSYFPAVPGTTPAPPTDASASVEDEAIGEDDVASEHGTMSASSSIEHFARNIAAGLADSVGDHSSQHSHGSANVTAAERAARPSTRVLDLVNQALGPLAGVLSKLADEDAEKAAKEADEAAKDAEEVPKEAEKVSERPNAENIFEREVVDSPEQQTFALPELDNEPLLALPEVEDAAVEPSSPTVTHLPAVDAGETIEEPASLEPAPSDASLASETEIVETVDDQHHLDTSIGPQSSSSSTTDMGTPLFDRTLRDSSESAPPSEAGHSSSSDSHSGGKRQSSGRQTSEGTGRPWANGQSWQNRLSLRRDVVEDDDSSDGEEEDHSNPLRRSFVGHYAQLIAEEVDSESEHGDDGSASEGDAYSSSGVEDLDSAAEEDDEDDVPLAQAHPGALQAQRLVREQSNKRPSPSKRKSAVAPTAPTRNPFAFEPNKMVKRDRRGNEHPLPPEPNHPPPARPSSTAVAEPVGHPLLPQTDAIVRLRSQRSLARLAGLAKGSSRKPQTEQAPSSPELPDVLQDSVLAITESGATAPIPAPSPVAAEDDDDDVPLVQVARNASVGKALANLTKRATGKARSRSNTSVGRPEISAPMPSQMPSSPPRAAKTSPTLPSAVVAAAAAASANTKPSPSVTPTPVHVTAPSSSTIPSNAMTRPALQPWSSTSSSMLTVPTAMPTRPKLGSKVGTRRIYINGGEHYTIVEMREGMLPRDVLREVQRNGDLPADGQSPNGWALFELWRDLGVERPIREYEAVTSILASWPRGGAENRLVLKRTTFARLTSRRRGEALKKNEQPIGNNVKLEVRRGKWEKRWLVLDGEALSTTKSEKGKERTPVCHMTNWDVYFVPSEFHDQLRAPQSFALALKSTDPLEMFENVDEASWYFCCKSQQEATTWYNLLYDTRSRYLLSTQPGHAAATPSRPPPPPASARLTTFKEGSLLSNAVAHPPSAPVGLPGAGPSPFVPGALLATRSQEDHAKAEAARRARQETRALLDLSGAGDHVRPMGPVSARPSLIGHPMAR